MKKIVNFLKANNLQIYIIVLGLMIAFQLSEFSQQRATIANFIGEGERFTATDGQRLCARIKTLEEALKIPVSNCKFSANR
jgi:hypothetical protein